jgi:hypothetical protein
MPNLLAARAESLLSTPARNPAQETAVAPFEGRREHMKIDGLDEFWGLLSQRRRRQMIWLIVMQVAVGVTEFVSIGAVPAYILAMSRSEEIMAKPVVRYWLDMIGIHDSRTLLVAGGIGIILLFSRAGRSTLLCSSIKPPSPLRPRLNCRNDCSRDICGRHI